VTGGRDGVITIWDLDPYSGELVNNRVVTDNARAMLTRHVTSFVVSTDRETLYAGTTSGDYLIISLRTQRIVRAVTATRMTVHNLVFARDTVILGCGDKGVKIYHANGDFLRQVELDGGVIGLSLSANQLEVLATTSVGTIVRLNLQSLQHIIISESHVGPVTQMSFDLGNATRFATASTDGTIKVWDMNEYAVIATCYPRREQKAGVKPLCLVFADIIISGWSDGRVLAFSAETGENLWMLVDAHIGTSNKDFDEMEVGVTSMALSHNRRFMLTGGPTGDIRLWELRTRDLISHLKEHKQRITRIVLTQDDTMALTASRDRCILRWDLRQEKRMLCHMQRMGGINDCVLLGENDEFLISVGQDRKLVLWDTRVQDLVHHEVLDTMRPDDEEGLCIGRSKCGRYLVTGGTLGVLRLWYVDSHVLHEILQHYRGSRHALPGSIPPPRLNKSPFQLLQVVSAHSKPVVAVDFGLYDKQVVSVGEDGSVFVFFFFGSEER
jgi:WD40 repeat protein